MLGMEYACVLVALIATPQSFCGWLELGQGPADVRDEEALRAGRTSYPALNFLSNVHLSRLLGALQHPG